jgi:hypothetical protein
MDADGAQSASLPKNEDISATQPQSLEQRLKALEEKAPTRRETRLLRFGAIAGVLGTLISIAAGALTLYSGTIRQGYEDKQKTLHEFEGYIQQLNAEDQKRVVISVSSDNPATKSAQTMAANSASYIAANQAEQLLPQIKNLVTPAQFSLLAEAKAIGGDFNAARTYLAEAVSLSKGRERAEVLRFQGSILRNSADPTDRSLAFTAYKEAINILKNSPKYWGASFVEANTVAEWLIGETYVGDCTTAADLLSQFVNLLSNADVPADAAKAAKEYIYNLLGQQPRCGLDLIKVKPDLASRVQPPSTVSPNASATTPSAEIAPLPSPLPPRMSAPLSHE